MDAATADVIEMFGPSGDFEDYWLNNYGPPDNIGWVSLDTVIKELNSRDDAEWHPGLDEARALMRPDVPEGGGMMGLDPEYQRVIAAVRNRGLLALDVESALGKLGRYRSRW